MVLRPVGAIGVNLVRASAAEVLGERMARGEVDTDALISEIERVKALAPPYNRWVMLAVAPCSAAFFSQIPGGDWGHSALPLSLWALGSFFGPCFRPGSSQSLP
jgi:uncharacterized membrane protein YjjP (DUF1212 family)